MAEESKQMQIKLRDAQNEDVIFKVKPDTKFEKIFGAYCAQKGVATNSLSFHFDDVRIKATDTPKMLEMEDGDMVDVRMLQVGGGGVRLRVALSSDQSFCYVLTVLYGD